jgi:hypothetical protein
LFATLLWPLTHRQFEERLACGEGQMMAMIEEARSVLKKQGERLAIQNRYVEDIQTIWLLQLKLLRRSSKAALGLLNIPKFRAGYDFMLLRSQLGFVDAEIVDWWTKFQEVGEEARLEMIRLEAEKNQQARKSRRGEPKKPSKAQIKKQLMKEADSWQEVRDIENFVDHEFDEDVPFALIETKPADKPKRRRRSSWKGRRRVARQAQEGSNQ